MSQSSPRRRARELVLQALYTSEMGDQDDASVIDSVLVDSSLSRETIAFARDLYQQVREHQSWADSVIADYARNWSLERMASIDRNILRLGLVELSFRPDSPPRVAINEAIELAKAFSTADSASFINGILDRFIQAPDTPSQA